MSEKYQSRLYAVFFALTLALTFDPTGSALAEEGASSLPDADEVIEAVRQQQEQFSAGAEQEPAAGNNAYQFSFEGLMVENIPLSAFSGQVILVVNTASRCGYTPQYEGLQSLHETYKEQGFTVLGVPSNDFGGQEPGTAEEIDEFCRVNYGVTFPMAAKSKVVGADAHPFYRWAEETFGASAVPKWNFHKILIARNGAAVDAFSTKLDPQSDEITTAIERALVN